MKKKLFSVTLKDCTVQTFSVGGHGGAGKDTSNSGVRIVHPPSGASGEGRAHRSQFANKQEAFKKLAQSEKFRKWARMKAAQMQGINVDELIDKWMEPQNLKIEVRNKKGQWEPD